MATESIEGPEQATVRMIVVRGTVMLRNPFNVRRNTDGTLLHEAVQLPRHEIERYVGEEVMLTPEDAKHLHAAGFVRRPDEELVFPAPPPLSRAADAIGLVSSERR